MTSSSTAVPAAEPRRRSTQWVHAALCGVLLVSAFAVDPFADAAFDAPKRVLSMTLIVLAALAAGWSATWPQLHRWSSVAFWMVCAMAFALAAALLAVLLSAQPWLSWEALRQMLVYALLLPLGASAAVQGALGVRWLFWAVAVVGLTALLSLLQAAGMQLPLLPEVVQLGGRFATGALLGNEGYVALACALLGAAAGALWLHPAARRWRGWAAALFVLALLTITVNRQLTSALALLAAVLVLLAWRWRVAWVLPSGAALVVLIGVCASVPLLRDLTFGKTAAVDVARLQELSTYRLGAWAAAAEMTAQHPWSGLGPGSFARHSQNYRLLAEVRLAQRLTPAPNANGFVQAHQEYLQLAAECGMPALLAVLTALGLLLGGLQRLAWRSTQPEALLLLAVISAASVAALAWFPLQIPVLAVLILIACGRGWRLLAHPDAGAVR